MITYKKTPSLTAVQDGFTDVLNEAFNTLEEQGIVPLGKGYEDVIADTSVFETYKSSLNEGLGADDAENLEVLMNNTRVEHLRENSVEGIKSISALAMPTLRKMYPKLAIKNAIPTQAVESPKFSISVLKPYVVGADGEKGYLPQALTIGNDVKFGKELSSDPIEVPAKAFDLLTPVNESAAEGATLDKKFRIVHAVIDDDGTDVEVDVKLILDTLEIFSFSITGGATTDTLFGTLDREHGTITMTSLGGKIKSVVVEGMVSQETNRNTAEVGFENDIVDHVIGNGIHINASVPTEWLQDNLALLQIDGVAKVIDIASSVVGMKLDTEGYEFLTEEEGDLAQYRRSFDVRPYARYTGSPKEWLHELKRVIDHLATKMKNESYFSGGHFVIIGNPIDTDLIPNVSWTFTASESEQAGVAVDYNLGALSGSNKYKIVSAPMMPQGKLYLFYVSNNTDQATFKYAPYSFNVVKDGSYRNETNSLVPSIMVSKRHKFFTVTPLIGAITILNNDGTIQSQE